MRNKDFFLAAQRTKNIIKEVKLIVFDVNFNIKINLNDLKILFINKKFIIKFRRFVANDVNYKTLQNL